MPAKRFPLVGSIVNRNVNAVFTKDQLFQNCYPEVYKNAVSGAVRAYLNKRPGCTSSAISGVQNGSYAGCIWDSNSAANSPVVFSYNKTSNTAIGFYNTAGTQIGGDITATDCISITDTMISTTGNLVAIINASGTLQAWYFPEGGSWTKITDGDFPTNLTASHPAHMDGYMFVMGKDGNISNSDLNSVSAWTANSFLNASTYPDRGIGVARYRNMIAGFGSKSIEFFTNVGNASGSPLQRVGTSASRVGAFEGSLTYAPTIRAVGDNVYWIGVAADSGAPGVYRFNGLQPEKISTPAIDKNPPVGIQGAFSMHGMTHIQFDNFVYCVESNTWWSLSMGTIGTPKSIVGVFQNSATYGLNYFVEGGSAKVFATDIAAAAYQDDTHAYSQIVRTENIDLGTQSKKFWKRIRPVCDKQSSTSTLTVDYSDDDFNTFTTWGTIDLSSQSAIESGLTRGGSSRRRSFRLTHASATPNRMEAIEVEYEIGTS